MKTIYQLVFALILMISSFLTAQDPWKGDEYAKNSESQKSSAQDFMEKGKLSGFSAILDVGCGDGKITAAMAEAIPHGSVIGVDISSSMIEFAKQAFQNSQNLTFLIQDAAKLDFQEKFDLITSFTVMQWVLPQEQALQCFKKALKPDGRLWIQMPTGLPREMQQAVNETISSKKWKGYFAQFIPPWRFYQSEEYRSLLTKTGLAPLRIETIQKHERFPTRDVFQSFLKQWFPYLRPLPENLKDIFLTDLLDRYLQALLPNSQGALSFIVDRLEMKPFTVESGKI